MATYRITYVLEAGAAAEDFALVENGSSKLVGGGSGNIQEGTTLQLTAYWGSVYLNGTSMGRTYTHTVNSDTTVTYSSDWNVYIVAEEASGGSGGGHKVMVGGTVYEVSGGKAMVGGTAYKIANGKTLIDGTAYEIAFGSSEINIKITSSSGMSNCYALINGAKYYQSNSTAKIQSGDSIQLCIENTTATKSIIINGVTVATQGSQVRYLKYTYTPTDANVKLALRYTTSSASITVTTS